MQPYGEVHSPEGHGAEEHLHVPLERSQANDRESERNRDATDEDGASEDILVRERDLPGCLQTERFHWFGSVRKEIRTTNQVLILIFWNVDF